MIQIEHFQSIGANQALFFTVNKRPDPALAQAQPARWALAAALVHQKEGQSLDQVQARQKLKGRATSPILVDLRLLCRMLTRRVCLMH